jgi:hypothetical protein
VIYYTPTWLQAAAGLENPWAAKLEGVATEAASILSTCALRCGQLDAVSAVSVHFFTSPQHADGSRSSPSDGMPAVQLLVDLLNKHEHTPALVAELLRYSQATSGGDGSLVCFTLGFKSEAAL